MGRLYGSQPPSFCRANVQSTDFNSPNGALLGVMSAAFSIGAACAVPFVPYVNDRWGRKVCIVFGSIIIAIGAILQTASVDSKSTRHPV
jgi:MFS family permease